MTAVNGILRVAVIDRDSGFLRALGARFEAAGWQHRFVAAAVPAEELVAMKLNALLLDPEAIAGESAWSYLERVGGLLPELGLIVCARESTVAERVRGLRLGADDWIAKPVHPEEAMARIEAVVRRRRRRAGAAERGPQLAGELEIREDQFQAFVSGRSVELTRREFELLRALVDAAGTVLERDEIYRRVWGYEMAHGDRSVDVFVRKLRSKIARRSPQWTYIHTHFGIGYRFQPLPPGEDDEAGAGASPSSGPAGERARLGPRRSAPGSGRIAPAWAYRRPRWQPGERTRRAAHSPRRSLTAALPAPGLSARLAFTTSSQAEHRLVTRARSGAATLAAPLRGATARRLARSRWASRPQTK